MAARGHVQDPNDRRLRPIYGKESMGSCTFLHVWVFDKHLHGLNLCSGLRKKVLESWVMMRPHHLHPRSLLLAAPNDSAPYPVCNQAGVGHCSHGSLGVTVCPCANGAVILGGVVALNSPDIFVIWLVLKIELLSPLLTLAFWQLVSVLICQLATGQATTVCMLKRKVSLPSPFLLE